MMSSRPRLPEPLREVADLLEETGWAAELFDDHWRLMWVSPQIIELLGEDDETKLGYGRHLLDHISLEPWASAITPESAQELLRLELPLMIGTTPGGKEGLKREVDESFHPFIDAAEPAEGPPVWASRLEFVQGDLPPVPVNFVCTRVRTPEGEQVGWMTLYGPGLPATILSLVARGDTRIYERMRRLVEPGRRAAALLFADLEDSGVLSRRLASATYFRLVSRMIGAMDDVIASRGGIVGKHAGDGATAYFLAVDLGATSAAARAVIEAARDIAVVTRDAAKELADEGGAVDPEDVKVNVGVHWGGQLYLGQLVTGGRLEVTALGDQVNECARIQESARDGQVLASKSLIEQLGDADARALGIDPDAVVYRTIDELAHATDKARRDAGAVPVTSL